MIKSVSPAPNSKGRTLSGIQPTGEVHLGNYFGALRQWAEMQYTIDAFYMIADLHALTLPWDPANLRTTTLGAAETLIAVGLDPNVCTIFVQSQVGGLHTQLGWFFECLTSMGELGRMTQFKDKGKGQESTSAGFFTYPTLQASDILLYNPNNVPVGEDQRQHVELARNLAQRFNGRFGETFTIPEVSLSKAGAKIKDLQYPERKMSKSGNSPQGTLSIFDEPGQIERKIKRAVTDTINEVNFDPDKQPGVSNLLTILAAATDGDPKKLAAQYQNYGSLKTDTAAAIIEHLRPIRERKLQLQDDRGEVLRVLVQGTQNAQEVGQETVIRAKQAMGLLG